jgi:hypothetical protein
VAGVLGLALLVTVVVLVFAVATLVDSRGRIARKVQETKKANDELEKALEKQERDLYSLHFTLAQRDWLAGDFGLAREHLAACPARQRDRDWRFLHRLCHLEVFSFGTEDGPVPRLLAYRPDGRCLAATFSDYSLKLWDTATGQEVFARQAGDFKFLSFAFIDSGERLVLFGRKALGPDGKAAINRVRVDVWEPASGTNVHTHTWTSAIKTSSRPETTNQRVASDILSVVHELRVKM